MIRVAVFCNAKHFFLKESYIKRKGFILSDYNDGKSSITKLILS